MAGMRPFPSRSLPSIALVVWMLAPCACDRGAKGSAPAASAAPEAPSPAPATAAAEDGAASAPAEGGAPSPLAVVAEIPGLGRVPPWSATLPGGKLRVGTVRCGPSDAARAALRTIAAGKDEDVTAGRADAATLERRVDATPCPATTKALAVALNDGGYAHYQKKAYDAANQHFRAALSVYPPFVLARYNLACTLALAGKHAPAVAQLGELARAAEAGEARAANALEKAKTDPDLAKVRSDAAFAKAVGASVAGLVGPRKDPALSAKAVALLPESFRKVKDEIGVTKTGLVLYHPAVTGFFTWRPDPSTELLVATIVDDPKNLGPPKGDINQDYGAIAVLRRDDAGALTLLHAAKTGESPPTVAAAKSGAVQYTFDNPCGELSGTLTFRDGAVAVKQQTCDDLYR